ncbi:MAG: glycosyltransferase family 1 protein [Sphingobacteriales bacterium]|nr:MAG: glycosyltransferase family 1 protein [Sphingobacteriales bacterium]
MDNQEGILTKTVIFVGNTSWSMWNFRSGILKHLKRKGYRVIVAAPNDKFVDEMKANGIEFVPLKFLNRKGLNPLQDFLLFLELLRLYLKKRPNFIFHYTAKPNIYGSFAAGLSRTWSCAMVSGLGYAFMRENLFRKFVTALYRYSFQFSKKVIFLNQDDLDDFIMLRILPDFEKTILFNGEGVDTGYFKSSYSKNEHSKIFLFVGRLLKDKGINEYVEAAKILKKKYNNTIFQILGPLDANNPAGISEEKLNEWIAEGDVTYLGESHDVRPQMESATAIVLPSYMEGLSRVLMEAASMGIPILASDIRGCKETVEVGKNGILFEPKSSVSLVEALDKFMKLTAEEIEEYGQHSRQKAVKEFAEFEIIKKYDQLLTI